MSTQTVLTDTAREILERADHIRAQLECAHDEIVESGIRCGSPEIDVICACGAYCCFDDGKWYTHD